MSDKKSITIRMPQELYEAIKFIAEREHRSLNKQCVHLLFKAIREKDSLDE